MPTATATLHPFAAATAAGREPYKVKDLSLADFGRNETAARRVRNARPHGAAHGVRREAAARGARASWAALHMTVQTAVLIETLAQPRRRCAMGVVQHFLDPGSRGRGCRRWPPRPAAPTESAGHSGVRVEGRDARGVLVVHRAGAGCGRTVAGPNLILDDGGDATLLVHKGAEYEKAGKVPAFNADKDPEEWGVILRRFNASKRRDNPPAGRAVRGRFAASAKRRRPACIASTR